MLCKTPAQSTELRRQPTETVGKSASRASTTRNIYSFDFRTRSGGRFQKTLRDLSCVVFLLCWVAQLDEALFFCSPLQVFRLVRLPSHRQVSLNSTCWTQQQSGVQQQYLGKYISGWNPMEITGRRLRCSSSSSSSEDTEQRSAICGVATVYVEAPHVTIHVTTSRIDAWVCCAPRFFL